MLCNAVSHAIAYQTHWRVEGIFSLTSSTVVFGICLPLCSEICLDCQWLCYFVSHRNHLGLIAGGSRNHESGNLLARTWPRAMECCVCNLLLTFAFIAALEVSFAVVFWVKFLRLICVWVLIRGVYSGFRNGICLL